MKTTKVLDETNRYENGKRINIRTIETVTMLSDDIAALAGYQNSLAAHQGVLEKLNATAVADDEQRDAIQRERIAIGREMAVLREAIRIQQNYIGGFEDENQD